VVTRNTALDYIKKTYKYELKENDVYFDEKETLTDDENESQNRMDQILTCLQQLPDGYRMVFNLFYIDNLTHKEIGTFLNISENTSKTQLMNAKKYMQKLLNEQKELSYGNG
jgi:RNA polymerase sigma-70 factor (ECF subfamily)